ncbi:MAG: hypothetical protein AAF628_13905 [Planctomycetota bacterium]
MSRLTSTAGVTWLEGQWIGAGPGYEARFDRAGMTFVPALGKRAPRLFPVRFELQSYGRRQGRATDAAPAEPARDGNEVALRRHGVAEQYEMRVDGVEQSFTFATLPPGGGDLVVRCRLTTELSLVHAASDELRFELDGIGGVCIGKVVGIDGDGARVEGAMRLDDGVLELTLPAAFVDRAAAPLVLDPLIGAYFLPTIGSDDEDPDVAYDATFDTYITVWQRRFSSGNTSILGQRQRGSSPVGGLITIRSSAFNGIKPVVANIRQSASFAMAWEENRDIMGAGVHASTGGVTAVVTVAGGANLQRNPDIGGDATTVEQEAVVVWEDLSQSKIVAVQLRIPPTGAVVAFDVTEITDGSDSDRLPAISKSAGAIGLYLIVWERDRASTDIIGGAIISRNISFAQQFLTVAASSSVKRDPDCDGDADGTCWVVGYATEVVGSGISDIACSVVCYDQLSRVGYVSAPEVIVEGGAVDDQIDPAVCVLDGSALVAFRERVLGASLYTPKVRSVDLFDCGVCEGKSALQPFYGENAASIEIASQLSGGGAGTEAMIVWDHYNATYESDVLGHLYRGDDGLVTDLGGGCGSGGTAYATCARSGNGDFDMRLQSAAWSVNSFLLLARKRGDFPCGPCTIVPDFSSAVVFPAGATDFRGRAAVTTRISPIPTVVGVQLYLQWAIVGSSCYSVDFSNALSVTIQ